MSGNGYKPDKRLSSIFDAVEQQADEVLEEVCPLFSELAAGQTRYSDEELLGKGGLKEVYKAFDNHTRQWVALARLRSDRGLNYYDLFIREAWLVSSLNHPNIIKIHDAGSDALNRPFFTMDLKRGTSLADLIKDGGSSRTELLEIFLKICDAVAYAHAQAVIHLDLKPDNVQCDRFGEVLVCDWGLGRALQDQEPEALDLPRERLESETLMGQVCGTLGYMAPEQVVAGRRKDERSDVYALGCILHTILTGEPPFRGELETVMKLTSTTEVPPLRSRFPKKKIPAGLEAVVLKAVAKKPEKRYASAVKLKDEIHKYLGGFSTAAETSGFFKEAGLFIARNRKASLVSFISILILIAFSMFFVQRLGQQQMATEDERVRANSLLSEVNLLSSEYAELYEASAVSKQALAEKLARSASSLKNIGIYNEPTASVWQSLKLVDMALQLDPACSAAQWQRFNLMCLQLNFKKALRVKVVDQPDAYKGMNAVARAFSNYHFTKEKRPSSEQLIAVINHAYKTKGLNRGFIEQIFVYYDDNAPPKRPGLLKELTALIHFFNGGPKQNTITFDEKMGTMTIKSRVRMFRLSAYNSSPRSILRFVNVQHLSLELKGTLEMRGLNNLNIETLDISKCKTLKFDDPVNLPQLQRIIIRKGMIKPELLQKKIRSNESVQIIEK